MLHAMDKLKREKGRMCVEVVLDGYVGERERVGVCVCMHVYVYIYMCVACVFLFSSVQDGI